MLDDLDDERISVTHYKYMSVVYVGGRETAMFRGDNHREKAAIYAQGVNYGAQLPPPPAEVREL